MRRRGGDTLGPNASTASSSEDAAATSPRRVMSPRLKKSSSSINVNERPIWQTIFVYVFFIVLTLFYAKVVASVFYEMPASDIREPVDTKPISYREFSEKKAHAHLTHLAHTIGRRLTSTKNLEVDAVNYILSQLQEFNDHACPVCILFKSLSNQLN